MFLYHSLFSVRWRWVCAVPWVFCVVFIRLSSGWLSMMLIAVVRVTHLNLCILPARFVYCLSLTVCWKLSSISIQGPKHVVIYSTNICTNKYYIILSCEDSKYILMSITCSQRPSCRSCTEPAESSLHPRIIFKMRFNLGFVSPCIIIHSNKSTNQMHQSLRFIACRLNTAATCFGHPRAHHQELTNCSSGLRFTVGTW
jgi:hypothetical protein